MSIPALAYQTQGASAVNADNLNTYMQGGGALLATMYNFIGTGTMTVFMSGYSAPGDGGQGTFQWNATSTSSDDGGVTTIQPAGTNFGRWIRIPATSSSVSGVAIGFAISGVPSGGIYLPGQYLPTGFTINSWGGSCRVQSTGNFVITCYANGSSFATVTYSAGLTAPTISISNFIIPAGAFVNALTQASADATLTDPAFTFSP